MVVVVAVVVVVVVVIVVVVVEQISLLGNALEQINQWLICSSALPNKLIWH